MPDDREIVEVAAEAAERRVFASYDASAVADLDVTVSFEAGELTVDVYLDAGAETPAEREREETVAEAAMEAAGAAVDDLFEQSSD